MSEACGSAPSQTQSAFIAAVGLALIERTRLDLRLTPRLPKHTSAMVKATAPERELVK